ncbi:tannase and feruloyl esterase [Mollisia scopiformis]|uniref:Carboxylic ester hydrolase n=1 Tax=Mollisia scopiformis TaxID=149040 RepID=A0A194X2U4_MOLSC|nr:tannase and feruloyl esterase [Mollisia scopiformis]KUJ14339.1 tannase and feruloyl esterase [Mollisia scopiformis]
MALLKLCIALLTFFTLASSMDHQIVLSSSQFNTYKCSHFGSTLSLPNTTVKSAQWLPNGTVIQLEQGYGLASCGWVTQPIKRDICRIVMHVDTSPRSNLTFEAWLPNENEWNDRFLSTGNGGNSGCLRYPDMAYSSGLAFAAVGTNNGHNGSSGIAFLNNDDVIEDFAYRAVHTGVVIGKQITQKYYGRAHKKSYYAGCSTGGRQGFKMVQDFPTDFDGVLAGCPALNFPSLQSWSGHFQPIFGNPGDDTYVPQGPHWELIHHEILKQCDGLDGVVDGIIEDTRLCRFRPEALQCSPGLDGKNGACLTGSQVGAVRNAFTDFYGVDGNLIYPRMQPGSEIMASEQFYANGTFLYSTDWFRYVVYDDTEWDPETFTIDDAQNAIIQDPFKISTWNGDLSPFEEAGGKLIHYSGLMDATITSDKDFWYYDHVSRTMGRDSHSLDKFYRLFRISGMSHCVGGDGAHNIGQRFSDFAGLDPEHNILEALVQWVEDRRAPDTITGTRYVNQSNHALGVDYERRHCRYPYRNFCHDPLNYKDPDSWKCII